MQEAGSLPVLQGSLLKAGGPFSRETSLTDLRAPVVTINSARASLLGLDATEVSSVFEAGGVLALDDDPLLDFFDLGDTSTEQTSASLSGGSSCSIMSDEPEAPKEDSRKRKEAGGKKGKKRRRDVEYEELKERARRLEMEKLKLLQQLANSRGRKEEVEGASWGTLSDDNSGTAAASGSTVRGHQKAPDLLATLDGQPGAEVLRRRMQLLSHMLNSFNSGGVDEFPKLIRDLYHEDCMLLTPGVIEELRGQYAMAKFWCILVETFPDAMVEVISMTPEDASGDKIDVHWRFVGTQIDLLPADKVIRTIVEKSRGTKEDSSSEQISLQGHCFFTFRGDKISKLVMLWSTPALHLQQGGLISELRRQQNKVFNIFRSILANGKAATEAVLRLFENL